MQLVQREGSMAGLLAYIIAVFWYASNSIFVHACCHQFPQLICIGIRHTFKHLVNVAPHYTSRQQSCVTLHGKTALVSLPVSATLHDAVRAMDKLTTK